MTTQFFVPPANIHDQRVVLPPDEARHAVRALRLSAGDEIVAVDGRGGWYRIVLDHTARSDASGHIVERRDDVGEPGYRLTVGLGLIKQRSRFETFLEKAVELGVSRIVPLITRRTENESVRQERSENILVAAMKQCGRSRLPVISEPTPLEDVIGWEASLGVCCHEGNDSSLAMLAALKGDAPDLTVLVGPEGGFTEEEVAAARSAGYLVASLGARRLRAETAAIMAAAVVAAAYDSR